MTFVALAILVALTIANTHLSKSMFYPPALYTGFWAVLLFLLLLCGDLFYPLQDSTLIVFVAGAVCFSLGGVFGLELPQVTPRPLSPRHRALIWNILDLAFVGMLVVFPFYLNRLNQIIANSRTNFDPFMALRYEASFGDADIMGLGIYKYVISLFSFLTIVAWSECDGSQGRRRRCWLMALVTLAYCVTTAARCGAVVLVFSLLWIVLLRKKTFALAPVLKAVIITFVIFAGVGILLGKGGHRDAGLQENAVSIFHSSIYYLLGGPVAFNEVVRDPTIAEQNLFAFFHSVANLFGADYEVSRFERTFVATPVPTNMYTIYLIPYGQFGFLGVCAYLLSLGLVCSWLFRSFQRGVPWATVVYARIAACILITSGIDPFMRLLSLWIQLAFFCWAVYCLPRLCVGRTIIRADRPRAVIAGGERGTP